MRLRRFGRVLAALALLLAPAGAAAEPPTEPPTEAAILEAFSRIAFGNEYVAEADPRLQKWVEPIRWRSYEAVTLEAGERAFLPRHIARLQRLSGHAFASAESWSEANFVVFFVSEDRYAAAIERHLAPGRKHLLARLARTSCLGVQRNHRVTHALEYALAIIPVERARARGLMESCIAEETTQLMGLPNDADAVPGTLFNDKGEARDLMPLDEMLVRLLYHPRLRPGMRRGEALAIGRAVLPGLLAARR